MEKHVTLVGVLHIVFHALGLLAGIFMLALLTTIGALADDPEAARILGIVGASAAAFLIVLSLPGIVGGVFLLQRRPWARILVLIVGVLDLIDIPLGTALGVYTLWVLMGDEGMKLFREGAGGQGGSTPPSVSRTTSPAT
jgi:hypothetical protein